MAHENSSPVAASPEDYEPFDSAWQSFAEANPALGLASTRWAAVHVRRVHADALIACGAIVRTRNGKTLAHRRIFAQRMFSLLIGRDLQSA